MPNLNLPLLNKQFRYAPTVEILQWVWKTFGPEKVAASSSFQTQSVPLLHLISQICPRMPVIFLDTGFHFPETLSFRDELQARFNLNLVIARPVAVDAGDPIAHKGLYRQDPDLCCYINKVEPMQSALTGVEGWVNGVRRNQTQSRQKLSMFQPQSTGPIKIHPMLYWTEADVWQYINIYNLPSHPLFSQGYPSVGCAPCTRPILAGEDGRAGRWADTEKTECGLHLDLMPGKELQNE